MGAVFCYNCGMETITKILKSRQTWTIVALFVINGFESVSSLLPEGVLATLNPVLSFLAIYFRVSPKQDFYKPL